MATGHLEIDERSIALHAAVADKIRRSPELLETAKARVEEWIRDGGAHPEYARAWKAALEGPLEELLELMVEPGERGQALRQTSPFAGLLSPRERWHILREAGLRA